MRQTSAICSKCGSHESYLYYIEKTGEFYCRTCNMVFKKNEIISFSWAEGILSKMHIDDQMDHIVQESTDNLLHDIRMSRICGKKAIIVKKTPKAPKENMLLIGESNETNKNEKSIMNKVDELLEEIFAFAK